MKLNIDMNVRCSLIFYYTYVYEVLLLETARKSKYLESEYVLDELYLYDEYN